jgi:hypothetical protein
MSAGFRAPRRGRLQASAPHTLIRSGIDHGWS